MASLIFLAGLVLPGMTFSINACQSDCPTYVLAQGICASDRKVYTDLCQAHCADPDLTQLFTCSTPLNLIECERRCKNEIEDKPAPSPLPASSPLPVRLPFPTPQPSPKDKPSPLPTPLPSPFPTSTSFPTPDPSPVPNPDPTPINSNCESKCPMYFAAQAICASDGNSYMDLCRAKCSSRSLTQTKTCPFNKLNDCSPAACSCIAKCIDAPSEVCFSSSDKAACCDESCVETGSGLGASK